MELLPFGFGGDSNLMDGNFSKSSRLIDLPSNDTLHQRVYEGYSAGLLTFASAMCIVFILVGVPGNLITIIALARCKKVRNATAVFIINLSLSDLLFCCFNLPLAASLFWHSCWTYSELLCQFFPFLRYGLLAVSLFTVLAITINRYVMIGHPRIYPRIYRRKYLGLMVAGTWIAAFSSLIPTLRGAWGRFGMDPELGSCTILLDDNQKSPKEFLFACAFVVPCISIIVCYARIFYIVRKTAMRSHEPQIIPTGSIRIQQHKVKNAANNKNNKAIDEADKQLLDNKTNENLVLSQENNRKFDEIQRNNKNDIDANSENSSSISYPHGICGPRILLKYIDSSLDSDLPPSLTGLRMNNDQKNPTANDRNSSSLSINKAVDFAEDGNHQLNGRNGSCERDFQNTQLKKKQTAAIDLQEVDSAVEESISSSENNQVEPSSSSGIDLPLDEESPTSHRFKKTFTTSMRRLKRTKDKASAVRKHSTMNTSGASILYPGRMTSKDRRLLKMILVIFVSFLICYLPITTTKIIKPMEKYHFWNIIGYLLIYLTTCINPIIYVVMSSEYRQAYWNLLTCRTITRAKQQKDLVQKGSQRT